MNYIVTWFYKESKKEASFYPQMGKKGSSALVHSIYMQIQIPFFITFKHYNPTAKFLFFTNVKPIELPDYLRSLFQQLEVEIVTLPYTCRPPKDWYRAWQNQFYLFDILQSLEKRMEATDAALICDADCLCRQSLSSLFDKVKKDGSALYEFITDPEATINGIRLKEMQNWYVDAYQEQPSQPLAYYGGEFIALRTDAVARINQSYATLWKHNLQCREKGKPTLNEEAHVISILAERLQLRNATANLYVKRMWTSPQFNNVVSGDEKYPVWHLPYEKKRGLYRLYRLLNKERSITNEIAFWEKAGKETGIPVISLQKRIIDRIITLCMKLR